MNTSMNNEPEPMYREKQVLALFAPVHRTTWWRWVRAGIAPPAVTIGLRAKAWRQSDLQRWQRGQRGGWNPENQPNPA